MESSETTPPASDAPSDDLVRSPQAVDVAQSLEEAEAFLKALRERYDQVQQAKTQQPDLEARLAELQAEVEAVKTQLAKTWEDMESQLVTWRDKEELFWQFLRFAGIGFALAMLLNLVLK
ncbi:MAG: hypothetical protein WCD18_10760 [Thermosynechococcaceae cyanobacterium]